MTARRAASLAAFFGVALSLLSARPNEVPPT